MKQGSESSAMSVVDQASDSGDIHVEKFNLSEKQRLMKENFTKRCCTYNKLITKLSNYATENQLNLQMFENVWNAAWIYYNQLLFFALFMGM